MKDPERLMAGEDVFARELLSEWDAAEQPTKRALRQSATALGVAAVVGSTVGKAGAGAATAGGVAGQGVAPAAGTHLGGSAGLIGKLALVKWVGIGVVSGSVVAGGASHLANPAGPPRAGPSSVAAEPPPKPTRSQKTARATHEQAAVAQCGGTGDALQARAVPAPSGRFLDPAAPAPLSLANEIHAIDEARQALADHRPDAALRALHRYQALSPSPVFRPEAVLLRREALELKRGGKLQDSPRE